VRAWVLQDYGSLSLEERPLPEGPGLLLRVVATGICGSDLSVYKGTPAMRARWRPPLILGHEVAGIVEEGPEALLGRAVALYPALPCGVCETCQAGRPHLCPSRRHLGFHYPGGLASWIRVPEGLAYPLPEGLPFWKGALAEPLAVAWHAVRRAGPEPGEKALVLGGGAMGALVAWLLQREGTVVHLVEPNPYRAQKLLRLGLAQEAVPKGEEAGREAYPLVMDTVGLQATLTQGLRALAPGGKAVVVGLAGTEGALDLQDLVLKEKHLFGSYLFTPEEFQEILPLLDEVPEGLVYLWPAENADQAFLALLEGRIAEPKLVLVW